jgi:hypothetical protein
MTRAESSFADWKTTWEGSVADLKREILMSKLHLASINTNTDKIKARISRNRDLTTRDIDQPLKHHCRYFEIFTTVWNDQEVLIRSCHTNWALKI